MNKYTIKLVEGKQLLYKQIYSLRQVELENLKTYIKIYLKTGLFNLLSLQQVQLSFLIKNQMETSISVSITKL